MKSKAVRLELIGLSLILLSFFLRAFFYAELNSLTNDTVQYKLEKKIDIIYSIVRDNYSELHPDRKGAGFYSSPKYHDNYKYAENNKSINKVKNQTNWVKIVLSILFVIGSTLIIWGKGIELSILKKNEAA